MYDNHITLTVFITINFLPICNLSKTENFEISKRLLIENNYNIFFSLENYTRNFFGIWGTDERPFALLLDPFSVSFAWEMNLTNGTCSYITIIYEQNSKDLLCVVPNSTDDCSW